MPHGGHNQHVANDQDEHGTPTLRGTSHVVAALAFLVAGIWLVIAVDGWLHMLIAAIYAACAVGTMAASALYHRGNWSRRTDKLLRRIDHSMPVLWIAASYTPVLVLADATTVSWVLMTGVWALSLLWIAVRFIIRTPPRFLRIAVPIAFGWPALVLVPKLADALPPWMIFVLALGGILITMGALSYYLRWPNPSPKHFGFHEVFHALVVAGVSVQYYVMYVIMTEGPYPK